MRGTATTIAADSQVVVVAYDSGWMSVHTWTNHHKGWFNVFQDDILLLSQPSSQCTHITQIVYSPATEVMILVLLDGTALACQTVEEGLVAVGDFEVTHWLRSPRGKILCASVGAQAQIVALGCSDGVTRLHELHGDGQFLRDLSLDDWGYDPEAAGAVVRTAWTPDSQALAVGYRDSGFVVWTPSGCRLMSSLRPANAKHDRGGVSRACKGGGVAALTWGQEGLRLLVAERECVTQLVELSFVKPASVCSHLQAAGVYWGAGARCEEVHVLHGHDRLLLITEAVDFESDPSSTCRLLQAGEQEEDANDLVVMHVLLPHSYISASWPLRFVAVSNDGLDIAVAGTRGLALYSRRNERWRLFGDVCQERSFSVTQIGWVTHAVAVCCDLVDPKQAGAHELVLYPSHHLDASSVLARRRLPDRPECMDCRQNHILLAFLPLTIHLVQVKHEGKSKSGAASASLRLVRELSMVSVARPLLAIGIVTHVAVEEPSRDPFASMDRQLSASMSNLSTCTSPGAHLRQSSVFAGTANGSLTIGGEDSSAPQANVESAPPTHCVLLRWGGLLSLLDMESGCETHLLQGVECLWLSDSLTAEETGELSLSQRPSKTWIPEDDLPGSPYKVRTAPSVFAIMNDNNSTHSPRADAPARPDRNGGAAAAPAGPAALQSSIEMPWWVYGANGVKLLCPGALSDPISSRLLSNKSSQGSVLGTLDHELEFDREVLPIGVSLSDAAIIGATQRLIRGTHGGVSHPHAYCLQPIPQSQPVLPCLLRRMLQRGNLAEARQLAAHHQSGPHFLRSLEWLLFTTLELQFSELRSSVGQMMPSDTSDAGVASPTLLTMTAELIRGFPAFADVVVSVSRKTDVEMWPLLFSAVGRPSALLKHLLRAGAVHSASCLLVVVDTVEGPQEAHEHALALIEAALKLFQCDLCAELLRFLYPPFDLAPDDVFIEPQGSIVSGVATQRSGQLSEALPGSRALPGSPLGPQSPVGSTWGGTPYEVPQPRLPRAGSSESAGIAPQPAQQAAGTSWFAYLWGGVASSSGAEAPELTHKHSTPGTADRLSGDTARPTPPREDSGISWAGARSPEGPHSAAAAMQAGSIIASHAWQWLSKGHLHTLAELTCALAQVPCSLAGIMQMFPSDAHAQFNAAAVVAALRVICDQFPDLHADPANLSSAHDLLLLFYSVGAPSWRLAMALSLNQQSQLQHFRQRMPKHWQEVRAAVMADETLRVVWPAL